MAYVTSVHCAISNPFIYTVIFDFGCVMFMRCGG